MQAVRRMKTSPLTTEELACIQEVIYSKLFIVNVWTYRYISVCMSFRIEFLFYLNIQIFMCVSSIYLEYDSLEIMKIYNLFLTLTHVLLYAQIYQGLRVFKYNWMSVWQFVVPHRDPSLLPRQWRVALGTQKSYKLDAAKREKRRLYESKRRKCKIADSSIWQNKEVYFLLIKA